MTRKMNKNQQVQFFRDCLLPQQGLAYDSLDVEALVDSELTTGENWKENIRPKAVKLVEDRYEGYDQEVEKGIGL